VNETVAAIVAAHRAGDLSPAQTMARSFRRIRDHNDPAIFISLRAEGEALAEAEALAAKDGRQLPLYGIPVAVKDNIDGAGMPTTAACPAYAYTPSVDSTVVAKLRAAGAIVIGKTNLDQFATGLVGVRSPFGIPKNPVRADLVPGGSSSGSAVAVSAGLVPLALGTDTAGSGRVPAMLNNIVGLKPSLGLVSAAGVVPDARLRLGARTHGRRCDGRIDLNRRARRRRSVFAQPDALKPRCVSSAVAAWRAARRTVDLLRRQGPAGGLRRGTQALDDAGRDAGRIRS
jgi:allophanate hydrolase